MIRAGVFISCSSVNFALACVHSARLSPSGFTWLCFTLSVSPVPCLFRSFGVGAVFLVVVFSPSSCSFSPRATATHGSPRSTPTTWQRAPARTARRTRPWVSELGTGRRSVELGAHHQHLKRAVRHHDVGNALSALPLRNSRSETKARATTTRWSLVVLLPVSSSTHSLFCAWLLSRMLPRWHVVVRAGVSTPTSCFSHGFASGFAVRSCFTLAHP